MNILFLGDVVSRLGRQAVKEVLPDLKIKRGIDLVFANVENLAGGRGATPDTLDEMLGSGVDYFTSGNHIFWQENFEEILKDESFRLLRPANYPKDIPGRGWTEIKLEVHPKVEHSSLQSSPDSELNSGSEQDSEFKVVLINLIGKSYMKGPILDPFRTIDSILEKVLTTTDNAQPVVTVVDFHAESTSEKRVLGFYLDGQVSAVVGTHTHVPTADASLLPLGTAYVTDVGMVGSLNSVLGVKPKIIVDFLKYPYPKRFEWVKKGPTIFNSVLISVDNRGKTKSCLRLDFQID